MSDDIEKKKPKSSTAESLQVVAQIYTARQVTKLEEQKAIEAAEYEQKFTKLADQLEELKVAMLAGNKEFASLAK